MPKEPHRNPLVAREPPPPSWPRTVPRTPQEHPFLYRNTLPRPLPGPLPAQEPPPPCTRTPFLYPFQDTFCTGTPSLPEPGVSVYCPYHNHNRCYLGPFKHSCHRGARQCVPGSHSLACMRAILGVARSQHTCTATNGTQLPLSVPPGVVSPRLMSKLPRHRASPLLITCWGWGPGRTSG